MDGLFQIRVEADACIKDLTNAYLNQIPFATSRALNKTAFDCNAEIKNKLPTIFDRPTNWTVNALYVKKSTKTNLQASLEYRAFATKGTPSAKIISHHVLSGVRPEKRSEIVLRQSGNIPGGSFIVPSKYAKIDQYGNVRKSQISKMLSGLRANLDTAQYSKGRNAKSFYVTRNRRMIFYRQGKISVPIFYIIRAPHYEKRYDPAQIIDAKAASVFEKNFAEAFKYAVNTAK